MEKNTVIQRMVPASELINNKCLQFLWFTNFPEAKLVMTYPMLPDIPSKVHNPLLSPASPARYITKKTVKKIITSVSAVAIYICKSYSLFLFCFRHGSRSRLVRFFLRFLNTEKLNRKNQSCIGPDILACTAFTVSDIGRDK